MGVLFGTEVQPEAVGKKEIMSKIITIDVVRHGEKNGDQMTERGVAQITATGLEMARIFGQIKMDRLIYSGANRTLQAATLFKEGFEFEGELEENKMFGFGNLIEPAGGIQRVLAEIAQVQANGDTVAHALEISNYAVMARLQIAEVLVELAKDMASKGQTWAIVASHGNYSEMATVDPQMPYGICEGDRVRYIIREDGRILSTTLHRCPIPGGRN